MNKMKNSFEEILAVIIGFLGLLAIIIVLLGYPSML
jgi:hypothetical protein